MLLIKEINRDLRENTSIRRQDDLEGALACEREGAVAQSIERATPGEEVLGSILAVAARTLLGGCQYNVTG